MTNDYIKRAERRMTVDARLGVDKYEPSSVRLALDMLVEMVEEYFAARTAVEALAESTEGDDVFFAATDREDVAEAALRAVVAP